MAGSMASWVKKGCIYVGGQLTCLAKKKPVTLFATCQERLMSLVKM